MLKKLSGILIFISLVCYSLQARPAIKHFDKNQKAIFEFLADDMEYNSSIIIGKGNVVVINSDYFVSANKAVYDTQSKEIVLSGSVNAYKGNALYLKAEQVKIKLQEDYSFLEPFYLQESSKGLWISAKNATRDKDFYQTQEATLSTCSVNNPIWQLKANEVSYDLQSEWLTLWHPRLCIYDVPILYFPYLSFSAGFKRKTGLLYPTIGSSSDDGLLFTQPFYIAEQDWWDATITPQVRSKRGGGAYSEFRMVDDKGQPLWANFGYFGDSRSYQRTHNLKNKEHFGFQLRYTREDLLTKTQNYFNEDGLYVDISQIKDVDYFRLADDSAQAKADLQGSLLTSRLNYFLKSEADYVGIYGRYYSDLEKTNNKSTMQTLPQVQYHRQLDKFFIDDLYYSFDYQAKNFTRQKGYRAAQHEMNLPFLYTKAFLDDFINISASPSFYATQINYYKTKGLDLENGRYITQHWNFKANSDLLKHYDNFSHVLGLETAYVLPGFKDDKGDFTTFFTLPGYRQEWNLKGTQDFYTLDNMLLFSHKMQQNFYLESEHKIGELENKMQYFYNELDFLSQIFYAHHENKISEALHKVNYRSPYFNASFGHFFRDEIAEVDWANGRFGEANYIIAGASKEFADITLSADIGYDYKENYFKTWKIGLETSVRCFSISLQYVSEIYPKLTTRGAEAQDDKYVLLTIKFIPLLSNDIKVGN